MKENMKDGYVFKISISEYGTQFRTNVAHFTGTIDWGDGTTTECKNVSHLGHYYRTPGEYTVAHLGHATGLDYFDSDMFSSHLTELVCIGKEFGEKLNSLSWAFTDCFRLVSIPANLFVHCRNVVTFDHAFYRCTGLRELPSGLFGACTKATCFTGAFWFCTSLGKLPVGLFAGCGKATDFSYTFYHCTALHELPADLFVYSKEATNFTGTFDYCKSLENIPSNLFDYNKKILSLQGTFNNCTSLSCESPYTMVDGVKVHLYERKDYPDHFTAPMDTSDTFHRCRDLIDYDQIPNTWRV